MGHLPKLIEDLALILITGAFTTILFKKIKQPLVLGYIIAGLLVGPYISLTPTVAEGANVKILAEIGVIFLLFSLGLEFSFKKLVRVGGTASITAFVEILLITVSGYFTGKLLGWTTMDSLFLGGMLASSSTTIIIRAFDELGMKTRQFARIVFGVLVVEDIVVILLMVLLSTMAVSQAFEGMELLKTVLKLLFFLVLWFVGGIYLIPTFLKAIKKLINEETLLILSIGLCLSMVVVATQAGFSAELGAFIMGSILAETTAAEKVEHVIKPVKDLFGAVFFVSVGMMIDPAAIIEYIWPVVVVTLLTLFGKFFGTTVGAILSGQPLKQSVQVGMSMAQIGEFAFIVATLGLSLGVISEFIFPVAVGVSAITTFTTPYMIKFSPSVYNFIERALPNRWVQAIHNYSSGAQNMNAESNWRLVFKSYLRIAATNGLILLALMFVSINFFMPFLEENIEDPNTRSIVGLVVTLGIAAPFLWAFMAKKPDSMAYRELWLDKKYNHGPLLVIEIIRVLVGVLLLAFWVENLFSTLIALVVVIPLIIIAMIIFSQRIQRLYRRIEGRFLTNLMARETAAAKDDSLAGVISRKNKNLQERLAPWDAHIVDLEVGRLADYVGKQLKELAWREHYGINIAYIKRGEKLILAPGREDILLPFDHVGIIATDDQIQLFKPVFDATETVSVTPANVDDIMLQRFVVDEHTRLKGKTIRESGIREKTHGLVIGLERNKMRILNPDSTVVFEWDDVVWLVGDRKKISKLIKREDEKEEEEG